MRVTFTIRECGFYEVPNIVYPDLRFHNLHREWSMSRRVSLPPYALDLTPVTNRQFDEFLRASGYIPPHPENFLLHWVNERIPDGLEEHPVVYVSLEDARAYADWAGKRLPTEAEWQFAAQGFAAHRYPWGDEWQPDACNYGQVGGTTPVKQFPQGRSPFGCYDLCGNVWEWTESERSDGRNRFAILKGGSFYRAEGSAWYADGGAKPNDFAAKFLLMYPGLDRCATIGLRCAVDFSE
jgi:formylglycine-generating enzyme required for sulfatase activity